MKLVYILFLSFVINITSFVEAKEVIYPGKNKDTYVNKLLTLALSYTEHPTYTLKAFGQRLPKGREYKFLEHQEGIDVIADGATIERESRYLPIHFPLLKGLNGWRVPLVNSENKDLFLKIITEDDFKKLTALQFHSWSDSEILLSNGLNVYRSGDQKGLYRMLDQKRVDYYPRSLLEVKKEIKGIKHLNITVDPHIFIHYPTAFYFYVNKANKQLAKDIKSGLEKALADGSFDKLFMEYFTSSVDEIQNSNRRVFELSNPLLSTKTPLHRKELWLSVYH